MKYYFFLLFVAFSFLFSHAQASMTKKTIAKNKVKTITEKEFDNNSNEGCNTTITTYDRNGNMIKWNWQRIGSFFEYVYDKDNKEIATVRKSKSDSTDVYVMTKTYDKFGNITYDHPDRFQNFYDEKQRLVKSVKLDKDKNVSSGTYKIYQYDEYDNLIKEIHYKEDEVKNTLLYAYDTSCRLVEKMEYDKEWIEYWNEEFKPYKKPINYFLTNITYDEKGRISQKYDYFSDPCESLDDHYTFKNYYKSNDLLEKTEMFFRGRRISTTKYTYTFH